jgi:predicted nucleotidyltransferase
LSLLARVAGVLAEAGVPYALIGASALGVHGVIRSSIDFDLFAVERSCLDRRTWSGLETEGVSVEVRKGDSQDPLAGVVRFEVPTELPVDLVVGKSPWQRKILDRAGKAVFAGVELPVIRAIDLILLKLYAGGPQDAWDVQQLLAGPDRESLIAGVERELEALPAESSKLWKRILSQGSASFQTPPEPVT